MVKTLNSKPYFRAADNQCTSYNSKQSTINYMLHKELRHPPLLLMELLKDLKHIFKKLF